MLVGGQVVLHQAATSKAGRGEEQGRWGGLKEAVQVKDQRERQRALWRSLRVQLTSGRGLRGTRAARQQTRQSSLKDRLYIVLSTVFSIFFQSDRRWINS